MILLKIRNHAKLLLAIAATHKPRTKVATSFTPTENVLHLQNLIRVENLILRFFAQKIAVIKANKNHNTFRNNLKTIQSLNSNFFTSALRNCASLELVFCPNTLRNFTDFKCAKKVVSGVKLHLKSPDDVCNFRSRER